MDARTSTAEIARDPEVVCDRATSEKITTPGAGASTRVFISHPTAFATIALLAAFSGYRIWQGFAGPPIIWPDSADYARSAVWAGTRPPLVPMLLGVVPSAAWFVGVQVAVGVLAWGALAFAVAARLHPRLRVVAMVAVLAFGSTTAVVRWDRSVLSESLAMSTLALLLAALLWAFAGTTTWPRIGALVVVAAAFASVRDPDLWVVWLLAAAIGVEAVVSGRGRHGIVAALVLAACAGAMLGGSLAAARGATNVEHVYVVRVFPYADRVDWFARHGMPDAARVKHYAEGVVTESGTAPVVGIDPRDPSVRSLVRWLHDDGAATYLRWLVEHPTYVATEPLRRPERAYNFADGDLGAYSGPERTELGVVDRVLFPSALIVAAVGVVALGVGLASGLGRRSWWWLVVTFGALGVVHMAIAWHGDGMETTRHVSVGNVQVRLVVLVLALVALGAALQARRVRVAGTDAGRSG